MSYELLSQIYDRFNKDTDFNKIAAFLDSIFKSQQLNLEIILDAGCGTGKLTFKMSEKGYNMIGVDSSNEMLSIAYKNKPENSEILFINQSLNKLDLYGTIDGCYSCFDVINHITDNEELIDSFKKISLFLVSGGLFIFDINTQYKFENIYSQNSFIFEDEKSLLIWQNEYNTESRLCNFDLKLFNKNKDNLYSLSKEQFFEKFYTNSELTEFLKKAGFCLINIFGGEYDEKRALNDNDERAIIIAKKI